MNPAAADPLPKLTWIEGSAGDPDLAPLWTLIRDYVAGLADGAFELNFTHLPAEAGGVRHPATRLLQDSIMLTAAADAAADADVVILGCWASPIIEARALLDTPVTGLAEGSARIGAAFGSRLAVVTVAEGLRPGFERDLALFVAPDNLLAPPVWWLDPQCRPDDLLTAVDSPGHLIDRFDAVATRAADAGADAILTGCGSVGALLAVHGYRHPRTRPDVPVLDCDASTYHLARTLHDLHRAGSHPSRTAYPPVPPDRRPALDAAMTRLIRAAHHP
ncbi:aspartate/glutamate racemase family protein [Pseudonocardia acaciae]|uniref:aspartate/glutamate racemase family protein n=1 Tax=Pseudonocardia acaciae TaxID=551276 RepID=UPI00048FDE77|nr:aspartate/glutamate racemase family protein [Pseudonocardia acaciae]